MTDKEDKSMNIPNLHPSQRPTTSYGSSNATNEYLEDTDQQLSSSLKDRLESFVGSYSRASLIHMAENVVVSETGGAGMVRSFFYVKKKPTLNSV